MSETEGGSPTNDAPQRGLDQASASGIDPDDPFSRIARRNKRYTWITVSIYVSVVVAAGVWLSVTISEFGGRLEAESVELSALADNLMARDQTLTEDLRRMTDGIGGLANQARMLEAGQEQTAEALAEYQRLFQQANVNVADLENEVDQLGASAEESEKRLQALINSYEGLLNEVEAQTTTLVATNRQQEQLRAQLEAVMEAVSQSLAELNESQEQVRRILFDTGSFMIQEHCCPK